jgi:hypothetical protein
MLQVVMPTPSGTGFRASVVGRSRKRKPWEFTWDDAGEVAVRSDVNRSVEPSKVAGQASEMIDRRPDCGEPAIELRRAAPGRRSRKRSHGNSPGTIRMAAAFPLVRLPPSLGRRRPRTWTTRPKMRERFPRLLPRRPPR